MEFLHTLTNKEGISVVYKRWHSPSTIGNPPLVLIHGAASNMTRWEEFISRTKLRLSHDILRLDLRGHGQSLYRGRLSLDIWCDDIAAILHRHNHPCAILIGHCLGANVAANFAARFQRQTAGLVLIEPILNNALVGKLRLLAYLESPVRLLIVLIRLVNRAGIYRRHLEALDLYALDSQFRARLAEPGGAEALARRYGSPWHDFKVMPTANFLQDLVEVVQPLPLEDIHAPFLALLSTGGTFVDPVLTRNTLSRCQNGVIRTLESKHWIPTELPLTMREMIEEWINCLTAERYGA